MVLAYLERREAEEKTKLEKRKTDGEEDEVDITTQSDPHCHQQGGRLVVVEDPKIRPYPLLMAKVEWSKHRAADRFNGCEERVG
jgi:hypothetical protein